MKASPALQRYGLAFLVCCIAIALAWLFGAPSACLLLAIMLTSLYAGRGPSLLAVGICALALAVFFLPPRLHLLAGPPAYIRIVVFILASLLISELIHSKQKTESSGRLLEESLSSAQRRLSRAIQIATVAELSASIAHEINQPLAAVVANGQACKSWLAAEPPNFDRARLTVDRIIRDGNAAADVVRRIRALFKQAAPAKALLDLNDVIAEGVWLTREAANKKNIRIDTDLEEGLPLTLADRVQIQQVIVNLVQNGIDAMEEVTGPRSLLIRSQQDGTNITVEFRDHGSGIKDAEKIFEPFFTTKDRGMGMGLAICRSIIEAHDGRLWATQNELQGATLSFSLPIRLREPD
jgi:signal transduction histidine kinase